MQMLAQRRGVGALAPQRSCSRSVLAAAVRKPAASPSSRSSRAGDRVVVAAATKGSTSKKVGTVVPEPSLNLPLSLLAISGVSGFSGNTALSVITGILGAFLAIQSTRVKFVFEADALEVVIAGKEEEQTENAFVGGRNRWRYDTFVNWELWWPGFPILVYFKETQTKPEGQIHFFPVIFNGRQLYDVMVERCGPSQTSGPK